MKITKMSREEPTAVPTAKTVVVKAGLPKDRLKGYLDGRKFSGLSRDERASANFTGADAQAALVGKYKKRNRKGFGKGAHERSESRSKERSESGSDY